MEEIFDRISEILTEICEDREISWYTFFESEDVGLFEAAVEREFGKSFCKTKEYLNWYDEIANDI